MLSCAVVGCGAAGMAASSILRQSGLLVTCFDIAPEPGGIWASNARDIFSSRGLLSPIYPSMRCLLPKELMSFSDAHFDYTVPQFPHHSAVQRYLQQYATQKGVCSLTRFNTKIESLRWDAEAKLWRAISVNIVNGDVMEWSFDKVCICTGQTQEVRFIDGIREQLAEYLKAGGELHHAAHLKDFRAFRNKRVVVVGDGATAYDYCIELKKNGAEVLHSTTAQQPSVASETVAETALHPRRTSEFSMAVPLDTRPFFKKKSKESKAAVDGAVRASRLFARLPWLRHGTHTATDVVGKWLQYRNAHLEAIQTVGLPMGSEGRGIRFQNAPAEYLNTELLVAEAKQRSLTGAAAKPVSRNSKHGTAGSSSSSWGDGGVFIDGVDAVVSATGFTSRYYALHPDIRRVLEADPQQLLPPANSTERAGQQETAAPLDATAHQIRNRGLYLGTLWADQPSLAFVGAQRGLLPPFLLFEAQARFVAYAFTQRITLPASAAALQQHEADLLATHGGLDSLYDMNGLGTGSAIYYNVLQQELGVSSRDTYTRKVVQRQRWLLASALVRFYHTARSMAPLRRKRQHLLFSNDI